MVQTEDLKRAFRFIPTIKMNEEDDSETYNDFVLIISHSILYRIYMAVYTSCC